MGKSKKYRGWPQVPQPLEGTIIDNHTHLPLFEQQIPCREGLRLSLEEQLRRASAAGVQAVISSACELPEWQPGVELAQKYRGVYLALAIHPNEAALHAGIQEKAPDGNSYELAEYHRENDLEQALAILASLIRESNQAPATGSAASEKSGGKILAVGETGLDYFRTGPAGKAAQISSFRAHIALAKELNLPLQIHDRDAHADTISCLQKDQAPEVTIFHCYSGDKEMSQVMAAAGWYASIAGPISYPANQWQRDALAALPRELVLLETDAPYLTPHPHRGQPNASYLLPWTLRYIAELWEVSEAEACAQLNANMRAAYGENTFLESLADNEFC